MTNPQALLTHYTDDVLGELIWRDTQWTGMVALYGERVRLVIELAETECSRDSQRAAIELASSMLNKVQEREPSLRLLAAREIAHAAGSELDQEHKDRFLGEVEQSSAALRPQALVFVVGEGGQLEYRDPSGKFFRGVDVIVRFTDEVAYDEVEVVEADR